MLNLFPSSSWNIAPTIFGENAALQIEFSEQLQLIDSFSVEERDALFVV